MTDLAYRSRKLGGTIITRPAALLVACSAADGQLQDGHSVQAQSIDDLEEDSS